MSYRKITLDGVHYEYTVGKSFVKFRGGDAIPVSEIGYPVFVNRFHRTDDYIVTPASIKEYKKLGKITAERKCEGNRLNGCKTMVEGVRKLTGSSHHAFLCDECANRFEQSLETAKSDTLRVRLDENQFRQLVSGEVVDLMNIKIILADIGYDEMLRILQDEFKKSQ